MYLWVCNGQHSYCRVEWGSYFLFHLPNENHIYVTSNFPQLVYMLLQWYNGRLESEHVARTSGKMICKSITFSVIEEKESGNEYRSWVLWVRMA